MKRFDVFISSPSDVSQERDTIQEAIEETSQFLEAKEGIQLKAIRWEKNVSSEIGRAPQEVINSQVGENYDIFIGILCNRFGQPTENYNSGTEEEFRRAFARKQLSKENVEILFYFKDPRKSETPIDALQFLKVSEFKNEISKLGIFSEFESHEKLKTLAMAALVKAVERLEDCGDPNSSQDQVIGDQKLDEAPQETAVIAVSEFDEDIGLIELTEIIYEGAEACQDVMQIITSATDRLGSRISERSMELQKLTLSGDVIQDNRLKKPIIEKVAAEMQRYAYILEQNTPEAKRALSNSLLAMQHAVLISQQDGLSSANDNAILRSQLVSMQDIFANVYEQVHEFMNAVAATPRMTSKLNQAKRRAIGAISNFLDFITETSSSVEITLGALKD